MMAKTLLGARLPDILGWHGWHVAENVVEVDVSPLAGILPI